MRRSARWLILVALAAGCTAEPAADPSPSAPPDSGATASCGPVETFPLQGEGHLVGDQEPPVPYNSTPPTSGWHVSGDVAFTVSDEAEPLTQPEQVTVLELGGALITYNGIDDAQRDELAALVTEEFPGQAAMTSYDALEEGEMALTSWGRAQRCSQPDVAAARAFIAAYATAQAAEPS